MPTVEFKTYEDAKLQIIFGKDFEETTSLEDGVSKKCSAQEKLSQIRIITDGPIA